MNDESMDKYEQLDIAVAELAGGVYVLPYEDAPRYDVRKMTDYCRQRGISLSDLTDDELKQFEK